MCNLYSITTNQAAIIALFRVINRHVGTPMPGVFPDYPAPVVRNSGDGRELTMMRWGMPPSLRTRRAAGHQHPQHVVTALAGLAEAGEPLPGALQTALPSMRRSQTPRPKRRTWFGSH
jgi:putative SOS response-associated peptidase YedK